MECFTPPSLADGEHDSNPETAPTSVTMTTPSPEPTLPSVSAVLLVAELALDAKYNEAASHFRQLSRITSSPWGSVLFDFNADIMDAASNGGCPHTVATRVSNILSQYLFREREKHRISSLFSAKRGKEALKKVLLGLRMNVRFWGSVVVQQRALQIWEPILGSDHPKIALLHKGLALKREGKVVNLDSDTGVVKAEGPLLVRMELDALPSLLRSPLEEEDGLFYLGDGPPDQLSSKLEDLERTTREQCKHATAMLRFGRSRALAGLYYSFAERFTDAHIAFSDSADTLQYETCVEIKLHRILWDAEHRTRIRDWEGAWDFLRRSHKVFLDAESPSMFFSTHFMDRFEALGGAIRQRRPIDRGSGLWDMDRLREQVDDLQLPASGLESWSVSDPLTSSSSQEPRSSRVMEFPPASLPSAGGSDAITGIDIEAWRDFVLSSLGPT